MKHCLSLLFTGLLASVSLRADESHLAKARFLVQTSAAAPAAVGANGFGFEAVLVVTAPGFETITDPKLKLPAGSSQPLTVNADGDQFSVKAAFDTAAALETAYPSGNYAFTGSDSVFGAFNTSLALPATAFPVAPQIVNFTDAQTIDSTLNFDLQWNAFTGANPDQDFVTLLIEDDQGNTVVNEDSISPSETTSTIYSDYLEPGKTYHGTLRFVKLVGQSLTGFPFPKAAFASETQFTVKAKTTGGGGPDTTAPTFTQCLPDTGTTFATQFQAVAFQFSEAMDKSKTGIFWSATLNNQPYALEAAKFQYLWDDEGKTLVVTYGIASGGWPKGLTLLWNLRPNPNATDALRDLAGNVLAAPYAGSFYTPGGAPGCEGEDTVESAAYGVIKQGNHLQTGPGPATGIPAEGGGTLLAFFGKPTPGNSFNGTVTLEFPAPPAPKPHQLKAFGQPLAGFSFLSQTFATQAELDANYPATTYALQLRDLKNPVDQQVTNSVVFNLGVSTYPAIPHFANFAAAQTVDPAADFILQWDAFAGAGTASSIQLKIEDADDNEVFSAPKTCSGLPLPPTATSIKVPKGTFEAGKTYKVTITFGQASEYDKTMPNVPGNGVAVFSSATEMTLKTIGGVTATAPVFKSITPVGTGRFTVVVDCTVGASLTLQAATSPEGPYSVNLLSTNPPVSPISLTLPVSALAQGFVRAVSN